MNRGDVRTRVRPLRPRQRPTGCHRQAWSDPEPRNRSEQTAESSARAERAEVAPSRRALSDACREPRSREAAGRCPDPSSYSVSNDSPRSLETGSNRLASQNRNLITVPTSLSISVRECQWRSRPAGWRGEARLMICPVCERDVPRVSDHHLLPKSRGGRAEHTVPICLDCHDAIHALSF